MDTEVVFVLKGEVKTHKERMAEESEDFLLTTDILHLLLPNNMLFVQDLHCIGRMGEGVQGDETEGEKWKRTKEGHGGQGGRGIR